MKQKKMRILAIALCFVFCMSIVGPVASKHYGNHAFVVAPSGDTTGVTDTANIQQAIDDVIAAGKGTVLLEEGDFYVCETLVGINFDGAFKGSGAGATVLHSIENFPAQDTGNLGVANPRMMMFYQDEDTTSTRKHPYKIQLSDFTVKVEYPTEVWLPEWGGFRALNGIDIVGIIGDEWSAETVSYYDVTAKNLEFLGEVGEIYGPFGMSIQNGLFIQGRIHPDTFANEKISGKYVIEGCHFENSLGSSVVPGQSVDSHIRIVRNTYVNTMLGPEVYDLRNSRLEVAFNDISISDTGWYGIYLANGLYDTSLEPGRAYIHHNHIEVPAWGNGIWIDDFVAVPGEVEGVSVFAYQNDIVLGGAYAWGIVGNGVQDVRLVSNTISGNGEAGILTGIFGDTVSGWIMVLNDVSDLEADVAPIWLGSGTSDCWVLTKGDSSTVLDEGTDNHLMFLWW
ncbi:MAG: hypothetical protein ACFFDM_10175 [Candidatus Thorarchaeota archaeon]